MFALAFGYTPPLENMYIFSGFGPITIGFPDGLPGARQTHSLILYPDGQVLAASNVDRAVAFNIRKVAGYLDSLNINFQPL